MRVSQFFRFSSKKFYELAQQENIELVPEIPEDIVMSKYLSIKQESSQKSQKLGFTKWQKEKEDKINYNELLNGSPYGSIETIVHRNCELTLISTNYFRIDDKKFNKVLHAAKPDIIMVQRRPEYHLKDFSLLAHGEDGIFSDREYLKQLKFTSATLNSTTSLRPIVNAYEKSKEEMLEQNPEKEILQNRGFDLCRTYNSNYSVPMIFGEMPMRSYRQWITNSLTLMEMQEIFKVVCSRLPRYRNLGFTPYQMATLIKPEIFMNINDTYMATIIEMLIATNQYKKITGIFGIVENLAVKHFLEKNKGLSPIINLLLPPGPKGNIVRDIQNLEVIEKHILLDVMFYGKQVTEIKTQYFHTTNAIIEKYGKETDRKTMMDFRYAKTMEYIQLMEEKEKEGETEIKKEFVRETLRGKV